MKILAIAAAVVMLAAPTAQAAQLTDSQILMGGAIVGGTFAAISNSRGKPKKVTPQKVPKCKNSDELVEGSCIGMKSETIVTGTGTNTFTQVVTSTFKYNPTYVNP